MTLPVGWVETSVGECSHAIQYGLTCTSSVQGLGHRYIRITDIQDRQIDWARVPFADIDSRKASACEVAKGDLLFARTGATVGKSYLIKNVPEPAAFASYLIRVRCNQEAVLPEFAAWYFQSPSYWEQINEGAEGTGQPNFNGSKLGALEFALPPLAEQRRIVAKLDALTARLARAGAELDRVSVLAANLRQQTLAMAFSGALTHAWRTQNGRSEHAEPDLPSGWVERLLEEISEIQGGIQVGKKRTDGAALVEVPYLRVANVQRGWLKLEEIKTLQVTEAEKQRLLLQDGDILMNEGGDRDKLGRGWVWRAEIPECIHQNHVFRIRLYDRDFPSEYVSHYANENGQQYFIDQGTQTTNLASISKRKVAALPVPIPPIDEAVEIVRLIDAAFTRADRLEAEASRARALLDRLEAAILARAFRGELVPQDPDDEPASVLLDRIRQSRAAAPKAKRGRKARAA